MAIRITGLGSGLDIESLVKQEMQAKRIPIDVKKQKLTQLTWTRDAYREMNTTVSAFLNEARKLTLETNFLTKKAIVSSNDSQNVLVNPTANAINGNYSLKVNQIAKYSTISSSAAIGLGTAGVATQNLTLRVTGELGTQDIAIANGDNVSQIAAKINAQSNLTGVKASYDSLSDKLTFVSSNTGSATKIQITDLNNTDILYKLKVAASGANDTGLIQNGQDAKVELNGGGEVTVRNNSFTLNGINFTLLKDPSGVPYTVSSSVMYDVDSVVNTIKGVFDKYNELIEVMNNKISEPKYRDYLPLTDSQKSEMKDKDIEAWEEKAKSGLLRNDSVISSGLDKMRRMLSDVVSGIGAGQFNSLASIGITTKPSDGTNSLSYMENGKIYVDETKLRDALTNSPEQVSNLFTKSGTRDPQTGRLTTGADAGIGTRLFETVNDIISGLSQMTQIVPTQSALNRQIDDYTKRISYEESTLSDYEQSLYSKYARLEEMLNKLNSQGSQLANFFQK
ncbi:flagellar filament capping protein FliD [Brevibacillus sp. GCM10020057]|uniref:flagellar filament capping protein FliD n=1 Tax=Brevibacillus sp. GCM10020057 TaxID=3317327 RepID=UPI00363C84AD